MKRGIADLAKRIVGPLLRGANANLPVATSVAEIAPFTPRAGKGAGPRLNLLVPSINTEHYFGGIHTAVSLYREMLSAFPESRIILTDSPPHDAAVERFGDHALTTADANPDEARQLVPFSDRHGRTLPVRDGDCWLATAWWTAYGAQRMAKWQAHRYGRAGRLAYLIQDFEPGFYAWSSQSAIALSTYRPTMDIGIFNTGLLADYFRVNGLDFRQHHVFEPTINEGLRQAQVRAAANISEPRAKRIVVYGRPSTPRNAFTLLCEGLREWGWADPHSSEWEVVAPGELVEDLDLGPFKLKGLGKLPIDEYAELLSTSAIGVSLMVSPHPSYPPLEMASFGMAVITNTFANKDLTVFAPNVRSMQTFGPEALADCIAIECARWEDRAMRPEYIMDVSHRFLGSSALGGIASVVQTELKSPVNLL